jgi:hypothetical protein
MLRRTLKWPKAYALEYSEQLLSWHVNKEKLNQGWAKNVNAV